MYYREEDVETCAELLPVIYQDLSLEISVVLDVM